MATILRPSTAPFARRETQRPSLILVLTHIGYGTLARQDPVTLVYSAHDEFHNDSIVLRDVIWGRQIPHVFDEG